MKEITIIKTRLSEHQVTHADAVEKGFKELGVTTKQCYGIHAVRTKNVAIWGWKHGKILLNQGHNVLVMERGYVGDRFKYTSLGWNGLNGYAQFPDYNDDDGERFRQHGGIIKPWSERGHYAVILGQVKGDASLQNKDMTSWYQKIAESIKDIPVYFRPHPDAVRRGGYHKIAGVPNLGGSLEDALSGAKFTIAYNSNSCLDSILAGVPCYAGDEGTMAYDLCMKTPQTLYYPDREKIVHKLAYTQWSMDEIKSGYPLIKLSEMVE